MPVFPSTDWCVLQGDHVDAGSPEKEEGSKSRHGGLLQKMYQTCDEPQGSGKKTEALRPKLKLMLLLLRRISVFTTSLLGMC